MAERSQQPLLDTLNKNVHQLSKDKNKMFLVPCGHSLLQEEDELLPGCALLDGSVAQGWHRPVAKPSSPGTAKPPPGQQHHTPTALAERGNSQTSLRLPLCPEALKCTGAIIQFFPFSRLKCGNCTFLKSCSYALGSTRSPSCRDTAPLILPFPSFFPLYEPEAAGNWPGWG